MPFYLKKDLLDIKAGTEMERIEACPDKWYPINQNINPVSFPPHVLNDWIEERAESSCETQDSALKNRIKELEKEMNYVLLSLSCIQRTLSK